MVRDVDVFISYAGEDAEFASELQVELERQQLTVWRDRTDLSVGDSLMAGLKAGLDRSRFGVLIVSRYYVGKPWTEWELERLLATQSWMRKRVLPTLHEMTHAELRQDLPRLSHLTALSTTHGAPAVAVAVADVVRSGGWEGPEPSVDAVFDADPLVSLPAAVRLSERSAPPIEEVVDRVRGLPGAVPTLAARRFLQAHPQSSAELLLERLDGVSTDRGAALPVPKCLSPSHRPFLVEHLPVGGDADVDLVCLKLEALGFVCATERVWSIAEYLDRIKTTRDAGADRIRRAGVVSLSRIFGLAEAGDQSLRTELPPLSTQLQKALLAVPGAVRWPGDLLDDAADALAVASLDRADLLLSDDWMDSSSPMVRGLAVTVLGRMRVDRSIDRLGRALRHDPDPKVQRRAARALANAGGTKALDELYRAPGSPGEELFDEALALAPGCIDQDFQPSTVRDHVFGLRELGVDDAKLYRAMGFSASGDFEGDLAAALLDSDASIRGTAALALSRLAGEERWAELDGLRKQAEWPFERVMFGLACLRSGGEAGDAPGRSHELLDEIRRGLAMPVPNLSREQISDILFELRRHGDPVAANLAAAWSEVYRSLGVWVDDEPAP